MEEKKTNYFTIIIMVVLVVVSFIAGLSVGRMQPKQKPEKVEQEEPKKQIEFELMDELADIAQLDRDLTADFFTPLLTHDGVINDMDSQTKTRIVYLYAVLNHKTVTVSGSEYSSCEAGAGFCTGIETSIFKEISALYGMSNFIPTDCYTYKNMYLFYYGGAVDTYEEAKQNLTAEYKDDDILMTDVITYVPIDKTDTTLKVTKEFLFKKNDKGYYLYSVNTK